MKKNNNRQDASGKTGYGHSWIAVCLLALGIFLRIFSSDQFAASAAIHDRGNSTLTSLQAETQGRPVRLAQGFSGMQDWQKRSFGSIDKERRLDRLLRKHRLKKSRKRKKRSSSRRSKQKTYRRKTAKRAIRKKKKAASRNAFSFGPAIAAKKAGASPAVAKLVADLQDEKRAKTAPGTVVAASTPAVASKSKPARIEELPVIAKSTHLAAKTTPVAVLDDAPLTTASISKKAGKKAAVVMGKTSQPELLKTARAPVVNYCEQNSYWSKADNGCLCMDGFIERGGVCVLPPAKTDKSDDRLPAQTEFKVVRDPMRLQTCLRKAGYFRGNVTARLNAATFRAFQRFRHKLRLNHRPEDLFDPVLQQVLFSICGEISKQHKAPAKDAANIDKKRKTVTIARRSFSSKQVGALSVTANKQPLKLARLEPLKPFQAKEAAKPHKPTRQAFNRSNAAQTDMPLPNAFFAGDEPLVTAATSSARVSRFEPRPTISDLFAADASQGNSCAPQKRVASLRQSRSLSHTEDAPFVTGSISRSKKSMGFSSAPKRNRLATTVAPQKVCLPQDLLDLLTSSHGQKPEVSICQADCQSAPASFSDGQKQVFARQYDIDWCGKSCLGIAEPMPLKDVMRIEREAKVHVCMAPQRRLVPAVKKGLQRGGVTKKIRALYDQLPGGYGNSGNIAVLIGNRNYKGDLPVNDVGHINVSAMKALLTEQLGYERDNVIVLRDATKSDMEKLFGSDRSMNSELSRRMKANPNAQLLLYYTGHASSKGMGMQNYLLPVDTRPGREARTAYPLELLYEKLRALDARTTLMFLEAGFTERRNHLVLPPNVAERKVTVAPIVPVRGLALFTAAEGDQKPLVDLETGIGLFTRYLIEGLAGKADERPVGNGDSTIDSLELHVHLSRNVRLSARKTLGLMQNPTMSRADSLFLSQLSKRPH